MPDDRTRREKLEAMADQTVSPNEAQIARRLLAEMAAATSSTRARVDDFLSQMTFEYAPDGAGGLSIRVHSHGETRIAAGHFRPGLLGSMLHEALRGGKAPKLD